ncbi:MAG TPA: potassium channel family protein [Bryobacteraceae bacterium]|nr:potassium channel family protein [Bryobacteraceae bacterium]
MAFVRQASAAAFLVMLTLSFQSVGMAALIHWGRAHFARATQRLSPLHATMILVRFTSLMFCLHILQILLWAAFYRWNCFPSWESAFYFSTTSYSTVGYGDLVLPRTWRTLGPVESVTGVLMCGLSASLLFAIVTLLVQRAGRSTLEEEDRTQQQGNQYAAEAETVPARFE